MLFGIYGTRNLGRSQSERTYEKSVSYLNKYLKDINVQNGTEFAEIAKIAKQNNTNWFVLGLPRSNSGNETAQTAYVREFANTLSQAIPGAKIRFQDESLTSVEAEKRLKSRKKAYAKEEIDSEAAAIILQDCIENLAVLSKGGKEPEENFISTKDLKADAATKSEGNSMHKKFKFFHF